MSDPLVVSDYLKNLLDVKRLKTTVDNAVKALRRYEFDAIAYRGMSGALIAIPLALKMKKSLIMVRKPNDGSHSAYKVEGAVQAKTYIIADDFISSGRTSRTIVEKIGPHAECLGVLEADSVCENWKDYTLAKVPERKDYWEPE